MLNQTSPPLPRSSAPPLFLLRLFFLTLAGTLGLVALYLVARRLGGALVAPLDFIPALAIGLLTAFGSWSLRRRAVAVAPEQPRLETGITVLTWLLVVAMTLAGTSPLAVLALWLPVIAAEALWRVVPHHEASSPARVVSPLHPDSTEPPPESLVQQLTRFRQNGQDRISGKARIELAAGEQTAALHVAFCPPLGDDPEVEIEAVEAEGVTIRATDCRSYGLRLEARRGRVSNVPLQVLVRFEASSPAG